MLEVDDVQTVKHEEPTLLCQMPSCPTELRNAHLMTLVLGVLWWS